eukprot:246977_1
MLRWMFTDKCDICAENVQNLLYVAKKYQLDGLYDRCLRFATDMVNVDNVCKILSSLPLSDYSWTVLSIHSDDHSFTEVHQSCSWPVNPKTKCRFRYLRVRSTGPTSHEEFCSLVICGMEIYH